MCGICGAVQVGGGEPRAVLASGVLARMTDALVHRGPDDCGLVEEPGVALGARRLSIVDLAGGHQPLSNEDGAVWAAQNGELYNHLELRRDLAGRGHTLRTRCDTEVLPHLYEQHGVSFPDALRGKFALAVWDARERRLVLARDRLGIKPLYLAQVDDLLLFSSELKSLLASGLVPLDLDWEAIDAYLSFGFVPGPRTPLAHVRKLAPGELVVAGAGGVHFERYWTHPLPEPDRGRDEEEWAAALLDELEDAVRVRLMADVPLGAMLSGGLDSSLVVALMARHHSGPVKTFSVGFREDARFNELADARTVASAFGCDHHELELSVADQDLDLAGLSWALDEPLADLSALGFLALSGLASRHVTVALSGQGADELAGGYERYRNAAVAAAWRAVPRPLRRPLESVAGRSARLGRAAGVMAADDPAARWIAAHRRIDARARARLVRGPLAHLDATRESVARHARGLADDPLPAMLYLDAQLVLVDDMLHYFDRASMAHSLEVRVPFLDHHVVELCARIPPELKVRRLTTKYLLKRAARGIVPDFVIEKPKIGFFNRAVDTWFRAQAPGAISDYLLGPSPRYADFLDRSEIERLVGEHGVGKGRDGGFLLAVLMLEIWLTEFLPRAAAAAAVEPEVVPA